MRLVILASMLVATTAHADPFGLVGGHLAYGIGGSIVGGMSGAHHFVDAGVAVGWLDEHSNRDGLFSHSEGPILTGSVISGFGVYPTFVDVEAGMGDSGILGLSATIGLVARVDPDPTAGLGVHLTADFVAIQSALRVIIVGTEPQLVAMFTIGFGRF